ncbi:MAG: hypothetical protein NT159_15490 [Proteobacteria bacterium]|nr:hypothetical protein [Pseudomonadota bacterium]
MPSKRDLDLLHVVAKAPPPVRLSSVRDRMRGEALDLMRVEKLADAAYSYRIVELDTPVTETLRLTGEILHAPWLLPASGQLTALACAVCTVGPRLEARVSELFGQKRASLALALDGLGNELLFAASRQVQDRVLADVRRRKLTMCGELRPGDPGLGLDAHAAVLRLAQADAIAVSLRGGHTLMPLKSASIVMGVGIDLPAASWSRCDHCPSRAKCRIVERAEAETAL